MTLPGSPASSDLGLVTTRTLVSGSADVTFRLEPGDRPLVASGESVVAGAPIAERLRDPQLLEIAVPASVDPRPGTRVADGELLFDWRGHWRVAGGELTEPIETPVAGIVRAVHPASAIVISPVGRAMRGIVAIGSPTRGRLHVVAGADGELR